MKRLYGTADLEAELFEDSGILAKEAKEQEYDLIEVTEENLAVLENLSEEDMNDLPALELSLQPCLYMTKKSTSACIQSQIPKD